MARKKKSIFVYGASGHAKVVIDIIEKQALYTIAFLADDDVGLKEKEVCQYKVIGGASELLESCKALEIESGVVAIGNNTARQRIADWLAACGFGLVTIVHPSAQIGSGVVISNGTVVMPGAVINSDTLVRDNVIINTGAIVEHDCVIGNSAHIAPGVKLCGGVAVGDGSFLGAGATVIPNIKIGRKVIVGAGATVIHDIPDGWMVVGTPAKKLERDEDTRDASTRY